MKITDEAVKAMLTSWFGVGFQGSHMKEGRAALEAALPHLSQGAVRVKPLEWGEYPALNRGRKLIATDCFGVEYARLDLDGQSPEEIAAFKARVQAEYNSAILSTLSTLPPTPVGVTDTLLDRWWSGEFENGADAEAQDRADAMPNGEHVDASLIIEAWLTALPSSALASHEPAPTVANAELQQEVETLREGIKEIAEREQSIRDNWARYEESTKARILELETDLEVANDKLRVANEALEPFAIVAEHDIGEGESDDDIFWPISNARYSMAGRLRVGHLRRARAALGRQSNG